MNSFPSISIILPTFNEEKNLERCLVSIRKQDYPRGKIELVIVDDYSKDRTVEIALKFGAKIYYNGAHNCEIGRSIGLKKAGGELILIIDADNVLTSRFWLAKFVQAFLENPQLVGAQSGWYQYNPSAHPINRYCALFGASKPLAFYLKKRNFLMATEKNWIYPQTLVKETKNYFLVRFIPENMPTLGSQGFLGKRKFLLETNFEPLYFHMDVLYELVKKKKNLFAIIKLGVEHTHGKSFFEFHRKFYRDVSRFFCQQQRRKYIYETDKLKVIMAMLTMGTLLIPLVDSLKGFFRMRDFAWFLHPVLCQTTLWITVFVYLKWRLGFFKNGHQDEN